MFSIESINTIRKQAARSVASQANRFTRFAAVGASGVVVNNAVLLLLVERAHWSPAFASVVATETAILSNFTLNDRWTFADMDSRRSWLSRAMHYNLVVLGGMLVAIATLLALTAWLRLHYLEANLVGIVAGMFWNYFVNLHVTWRKSAAEELPIKLWTKTQ
jgi:dolichol-phosphate mannosyltransferase